MNNPYYVQLGQKLACAYISQQTGVSFNTVLKKYSANTDLAEYWYRLAEKVAEDRSQDE